MSTQHTPGPWTLKPHGVIAGGKTIQLPGGEAQQQVAMACILDDGDQEANARLIAAAPEMLKALRRAVLALAFAAESSKAMQDDYEAVSAAIAKATGARP